MEKIMESLPSYLFYFCIFFLPAILTLALALKAAGWKRLLSWGHFALLALPLAIAGGGGISPYQVSARQRNAPAAKMAQRPTPLVTGLHHAKRAVNGVIDHYLAVCLFLSLFTMTIIGVGSIAIVGQLGMVLCVAGFLQKSAKAAQLYPPSRAAPLTRGPW